MSNDFPVVGFDIGGTKIAVTLGTSAGKIIKSQRLDNYDSDPLEAMENMCRTAMEIVSSSGMSMKDIRAAGIGAPGPVDIPRGIIISSPNMRKWKDVRIKDYIQNKLKVETFLENDANAGALAEWIFGEGKGKSSLIYLTMSTGIGGGIIAEKHLVRGISSVGGEVGHTILDINGPMCNCGLRGCYEAFCGGRAVAQRLQKELKDKPDHPIVKHAGGDIKRVDFKAFLSAVREKDPYALGLWNEYCLRNAQAVGILLNNLNPEMVFFGTIARAAGDLFLSPFKELLPRFCWKEAWSVCDFRFTSLGDSIGELSPIAAALNWLYDKGEIKL
jgi:glucokinase